MNPTSCPVCGAYDTLGRDLDYHHNPECEEAAYAAMEESYQIENREENHVEEAPQS